MNLLRTLFGTTVLSARRGSPGSRGSGDHLPVLCSMAGVRERVGARRASAHRPVSGTYGTVLGSLSPAGSGENREGNEGRRPVFLLCPRRRFWGSAGVPLNTHSEVRAQRGIAEVDAMPGKPRGSGGS